MQKKSVLFDLDGVLVTTDDCHYRAWKQMADEEHIPFTRADNERLRGVSRMASLEIVLEKAARTYSEEEKRLRKERTAIMCSSFASLRTRQFCPELGRQLFVCVKRVF